MGGQPLTSRGSSPTSHVPLLAVAAGGAIGTAARLLAAGLPSGPGGWPWGTFVANVTGSLLLGYLVVRAAREPRAQRLVPLLGTGALGSYTTFSIFSVETIELLDAGRPFLAATYVAVSIGVGLLAALAVIRGWGRPS